MKRAIAVVSTILIGAALVAVIPRQARSQEKKQTPVPGVAFLFPTESNQQLVVALSSISDSYAELRESCRYGVNFAQAAQILRDHGLRLVQADSLVLRFEAP